MERLKEFFWLCAGANKSILEGCPSESSKYAGIGATIFFTGIFAALAGGYALFTVFDNIWIAAAFGVIWGTMIFNLDRFIVSSMRKNGNSLQEFYSVVPRIILAIIISIVIAKPLELKIFDKEIESELAVMREETRAYQESTVNGRFQESKEELKNEIELLKNEIAEKTIIRDELRMIARQEADGTGGTKQRNAGPIYRIKKENADRVEQELSDLVIRNNSLIAQKQQKLERIENNTSLAKSQIEEQQLDGLASRIDALDRLTKRSEAIWFAHWFIILLFLALETAPVFVKLISQRGPYDYVLKSQEYGYEAIHYEDIAKINAAIRKRSAKLSNGEVEYISNRLGVSLENT